MNSSFATEPENTRSYAQIHRHLICWKSTLAGFAISLMTFSGLVALAIAFGGIGLSDGATAENAGLFAAISLLVSIVVAVFVGSYFSVRVARFKVDMVGSAQGLVLAALVCVFMVWGSFAAVGLVGKAAAQFTGAAAVAAISSANANIDSAAFENMAEDALGSTQLKSEPAVVVRGLSSRLMRGDQEGAKNYLAAQAGLTPEEATARVALVKQKVDETMLKTREAVATAMKTAGWSVFLLVILSGMSAVVGGLLATIANTRHTLDAVSAATQYSQREKVIV